MGTYVRGPVPGLTWHVAGLPVGSLIGLLIESNQCTVPVPGATASSLSMLPVGDAPYTLRGSVSTTIVVHVTELLVTVPVSLVSVWSVSPLGATQLVWAPVGTLVEHWTVMSVW